MAPVPMTAARNSMPAPGVILLTILVMALLLPAGTAQAKRSSKLDRQERRTVAFINNVRANNGLKRLRVSRRLSRAANTHSWSMIVWDFFAHTSKDGTSSSTRIRRYKRANKVGETLAWVPRRERRNAPWQVVRMWMNSPGHRQVLLSSSFRRIGMARQAGTLGSNRALVFTADFSSRR